MTLVLFARFSPMLPLSAPVVPLVLTLTVHVADGAPPVAVVVEMVGAVPAVPLVTRAKLLFVRPFTGSENVTVHVNGLAFVGVVPPRTIDETVGAVVS